MTADPLNARLFGYGVPYRVRFAADGEVQPLETEAAQEAEDLARELTAFTGKGVESREEKEGVWTLSMPFGRCGVKGRPREYLMVHHIEEGYLDVLFEDGGEARRVEEGEVLEILPGMVIRVRARARAGRRVLVGFQTEDRTPLQGNAAPFTLDGKVPEAYQARLVKAHRAFKQMWKWAAEDRGRYQESLARFFADMAAALEGDEGIARIQTAARREGAYEVADERALFARQQGMVSEEVLERIRRQDAELFRFPGMFGGITTLFKLMS